MKEVAGTGNPPAYDHELDTQGIFAQGWPKRIGNYQKLLADQIVAEIA
ncbi:hypothetical protein N9040_05595 [Akkermansiaceae bacterium]|nr:hypothetical protein [Akkermansiaceae bacterium]MDB4479819.1 hypothetical protein [Akkermansiaceae bacterium]MDB4748859.1 hypothetical protein [Akkermansiaceae bacterium]